MRTTTELTNKLRALSRELQQIHSHILEIERRRDPGASGQEWLNRLAHEPAWAWLRSVSQLAAIPFEVSVPEMES